MDLKPLKIYDCKPLIIEQPQIEELQRTEAWFNQRKGRFTGSKIKDLMGCTNSTTRKPWGSPEKLIDFNQTAMKYIYSKAKERQRNKVIQSPSSATMRYGTENESAILELLKLKFPNYKFEDVGFIEFIKDIAGASPDGKIITDKGKKIGLEMKAATGWDGVYLRHEVPLDQSNQDFWQLQSEMLALNVDTIMYVTAEPSENLFEPNITDLSIKYVESSEIHQKAIKDRCLIGNKAIELFLNGMEFHKAIQTACTDFEIKDVNLQDKEPIDLGDFEPKAEEIVINNKDNRIPLSDIPF